MIIIMIIYYVAEQNEKNLFTLCWAKTLYQTDNPADIDM